VGQLYLLESSPANQNFETFSWEFGSNRWNRRIMKIKITLLPPLLSSFSLHPSAFPQGPLTPPGAPAPTFKTLDQIEPRRDIAKLSGSGGFNYVIAAGGSYYLSGNFSVDQTNGINVVGRDSRHLLGEPNRGEPRCL
jgi:hypothetical protein